jgi:anion-transporting ATPase
MASIPFAAEATRKPIVVFCGKGGVGKTTLSLALGLGHARAGRRVVVVTSHPIAELGLTISLDGLRGRDQAAADRLLVRHIEPRDVLAEMFRGQFPSHVLAKTILSSKLYKSLVEVAPGLKELAFLTRLRSLAETPPFPDDRPADLLIWDAPATGHFLQTLKACQTFDAHLSGPFAETSREMQRFFADRARLSIVPVTTLEEMAVEESAELCWRLQGELQLHAESIACNLVSPMLRPDGEAIEALPLPEGLPPRAAADLAFVLDRHRLEQRAFDKLRAAVGVPCHLVRRIARWNTDLDLLFALSDQLLTPTDAR